MNWVAKVSSECQNHRSAAKKRHLHLSQLLDTTKISLYIRIAVAPPPSMPPIG
ncbi:hypothetical protein Hanom_Chr17g01561061 [Helianthus anomalus]